ncbi:MAG: TetR family transcriptional regulator C-terminal domain-containing protein [Candidatus Contendobacter sp.]|nr:TetR family transcriptional regulator C-terminal domain-containing protein [Candidatus Contendobacter sp.]
MIAAPPAQREWGIGLLRQWLRDGRVTPQEIAQTLAGLLRDVEPGFGYLEQALDLPGRKRRIGAGHGVTGAGTGRRRWRSRVIAAQTAADAGRWTAGIFP